ncbi:hypothetical protein PILCRDRAFT_828861 [Piloderma croceum F 1598]|uniref:Uncharacterized protein n=1 Tax=Piloderma croceum (strain F 1598) TaxID=765440 RepID=A0A0C3F1C8_PILCF|nr:hypothetical protein PILCRDRAFT_828861 [Piloderma croceum F 1598]
MTSEPPEVEVIQRPLRMDNWNIQADLRLFVSEDGSILVILHISIYGLADDKVTSEISVLFGW